MPNTFVIVNPHANRGDSSHQLDAGLQALAHSGLEFEIRLTEYRGHATELAEELARAGAEVIVAAGGDGTVHEVANGILRAAEGKEGVAATTLGILPVGSGNDFAWGLGLDRGLQDAIDRLRRGHTRVIDVGYVEAEGEQPRYFVNIIGGGFDSRVNIEAHKIQRLRGFAIYLVAVLKTLLIYYRTPKTTIRFDGEVVDLDMLMTLIANGPRLGGGFLAAPHASHDDGLFDLCIVRKTSRLDMLLMIPKFMKGQHLDHPKVTMARAPALEIISPEGFPSQADGEVVGNNVRRMKVTLIPQRLRVIV
ncbi:MAG: diacylglycerol kinase family lipid kinase [Caldilineae bacterium]|nr:MAG: diacylglycerol kinase family lipid kinase [Caldilineae bacterium]